MTTFRCARFPQGTAKVNTVRGLVEFRDGLAEVDDDQLAEALRAVPEVFGITEVDDGDTVAEGDQRPQRPAKTASKDAWVKYALATVAISEQQARAMTKDALIELAP